MLAGREDGSVLPSSHPVRTYVLIKKSYVSLTEIAKALNVHLQKICSTAQQLDDSKKHFRLLGARR